MENMELKKLNLNICHARRQALVTDQYETLHVLVFGLINRAVRLILFWNDMKKWEYPEFVDTKDSVKEVKVSITIYEFQKQFMVFFLSLSQI